MQRALPTKQCASATGKLVRSRFQAVLLEAIDQWQRGQPDQPTLPEAICRLEEKGISESSITEEFAINEADLSSHCTGE